MKRFAFFLLIALATALPARAEVSVSLNFFVDALEPHGSWIDVEDYGYCWRPRVADEDPDWRPYTQGHWAYTDAGWTWISDEEWGWATYHYGRWVRLHGRWCWVPGYEWAPAWVSWREGSEALGWAPLPPEARWDARIGFSTWTDGYYDVGPEYYNFVPRRFLGERSLRSHFLDRRRSIGIFEDSVNVTRIQYRKNVANNIFVGGPQPELIERDGGEQIERLQLRRDASGFQREWSEQDLRGTGQPYRALSRVEGAQLIVAAPKVDRTAKLTPPRRVAEQLGKEEIDRGWRGVDPDEKDRLRKSLHASVEKSLPRELPTTPVKPHTPWTAPLSPQPTNGQPPEVVRKSVQSERKTPDDAVPGTSDDNGPKPPRKNLHREMPTPDVRPQPSEKPIVPTPPPSPGPKRDDGPPKGKGKGSPPTDVPEQPKSLKKDVPTHHSEVPSSGPEKKVPQRTIAPQAAPAQGPQNTPLKKHHEAPAGPPTAVPLPPPQSTPSPSSGEPKHAKKLERVAPSQPQVAPRPQPQPPAQPAGKPSGAPGKKGPAPSDEDEKRKQKKH